MYTIEFEWSTVRYMEDDRRLETSFHSPVIESSIDCRAAMTELCHNCEDSNLSLARLLHSDQELVKNGATVSSPMCAIDAIFVPPCLSSHGVLSTAP